MKVVLQKPTSGKIFFGEDDATNLPAEKRGVGLVFQNYALYPHLTVKQNIMFPLENLKGKEKLSKAEMESKVLAARLRLQTREEIRRIQRETKITTVFVTHDQEVSVGIRPEGFVLF